MDSITITGIPYDCTSSLVDASFSNPPPITFNSAGSPVDVVNSYYEIFTVALTVDCILDSCKIMELGCLSPSTQTDATSAGTSPYSISAITTNSLGYSH